MKVLIIGGSSMLGKALIETRPNGYDVESTWYTNHVGLPMYQLDVCNRSQVAYIIGRVKPSVIIHCGIVTDVDYAERHPEIASQVCIGGTRNILEEAEKFDARVIFPSTNAVFNGDKAPYKEDDERNPVNSYGKIRKSSEDVLLEFSNWLIIRSFLMYGWPWPNARGNWAVKIVEGLEKGQDFNLVEDRFWQPTYSHDCAGTIWKLIQLDIRDTILHVAGPDVMSLYQFGVEVAKAFGFSTKAIKPIDSNAFPKLAERPIDSTYDLSKLESFGLKTMGVKVGLREMRKNRERKNFGLRFHS